VWAERRTQPEHGYTAEHDDVHGLKHLLEEAVSRLSHFGEAPTDEFIRGQIITSAAILVAAVDLIDRGESKSRNLPAFYTHKQLGVYEQQWMQKISQYLGALEDLQGQAQDEEHSTPDEAIVWAREQFKTVFGISEPTS
jgi:hypothetical protein